MIHFYKYHGAGNDFIVIDARSLSREFRPELIRALCHRRFGIGADGIILLKEHPSLDFEMVYYNSDGHPGRMCGNGARCITHFAHYLGIIDDKAEFQNNGCEYRSEFTDEGLLRIHMPDNESVEETEHGIMMHTGCPHLLVYVDRLEDVNVFKKGRELRDHPRYREEGINVNFIEKTGDRKLRIATYERGVEDVTWACGTGALAAAMGTHYRDGGKAGSHRYEVLSKGGRLEVYFDYPGGKFNNVVLEGPAVQVCRGEFDPLDF